jgi:hypothetical protein
MLYVEMKIINLSFDVLRNLTMFVFSLLVYLQIYSKLIISLCGINISVHLLYGYKCKNSSQKQLKFTLSCTT